MTAWSRFAASPLFSAGIILANWFFDPVASGCIKALGQLLMVGVRIFFSWNYTFNGVRSEMGTLAAVFAWVAAAPSHHHPRSEDLCTRPVGPRSFPCSPGITEKGIHTRCPSRATRFKIWPVRSRKAAPAGQAGWITVDTAHITSHWRMRRFYGLGSTQTLKSQIVGSEAVRAASCR